MLTCFRRCMAVSTHYSSRQAWQQAHRVDGVDILREEAGGDARLGDQPQDWHHDVLKADALRCIACRTAEAQGAIGYVLEPLQSCHHGKRG